jgi:hypothetical protein
MKGSGTITNTYPVQAITAGSFNFAEVLTTIAARVSTFNPKTSVIDHFVVTRTTEPEGDYYEGVLYYYEFTPTTTLAHRGHS